VYLYLTCTTVEELNASLVWPAVGLGTAIAGYMTINLLQTVMSALC